MRFRTTLLTIVLLLAAGTVFGATGDTMTIGGSVPLQLTLVVDPDSYTADTLTLVGATSGYEEDLTDIDVTTNSSAGWELWVQSTNVGQLINADDDTIDYTLNYTHSTGSGTTTANTAVDPVADGNILAEDDAVSTNETGVLSITFDQSNSFPAGYYSDLLTITVRAK